MLAGPLASSVIWFVELCQPPHCPHNTHPSTTTYLTRLVPIMKTACLLLVVLGLASAEVFYWRENNDLDFARNFMVNGKVCGGDDSDAGCPQTTPFSVIINGDLVLPDCKAANPWLAEEGYAVNLNKVNLIYYFFFFVSNLISSSQGIANLWSS